MLPQTLTLIQPDDWHAHFRDGGMMKTVAPFTARQFGRAIVMPNLKPPVTTTAMAADYRARIMAALPQGSTFQPLMTLYLTDATDPDDLEQGFRQGVVTAAKLYPANATTNSEHGVTAVAKIASVLERMQKIGMPLLIHGEVTDGSVDIFDREKVFIDQVMIPLRRDFPSLRVVFEHVTTKEAVDYVEAQESSGTLGATITAHHLWINRNDLLVGGIKPHAYCLPIAKREEHRLALVRAATQAKGCFFPGTDTAPHVKSTKECACGCAGIFTAINAVELYAQVFTEANALERFEKFMSLNGPAFYGLSVNKTPITLVQNATPATDRPALLEGADLAGDGVVPFACPKPLLWRFQD